jgi:hypothetical protein
MKIGFLSVFQPILQVVRSCAENYGLQLIGALKCNHFETGALNDSFVPTVSLLSCMSNSHIRPIFALSSLIATEPGETVLVRQEPYSFGREEQVEFHQSHLNSGSDCGENTKTGRVGYCGLRQCFSFSNFHFSSLAPPVAEISRRIET